MINQTANKKLTVGDKVNFDVAPTAQNWTVDSIVMDGSFPTNFVNITDGKNTRMVNASDLIIC
jgi:hypothetical protein